MKRMAGVVCSLLFVGCGGNGETDSDAASQSAAAPAERVVACNVLTRDEVAEVLGGQVTAADPREIHDDDDPSRYLSMCTYSAEIGGALRTATLSVKRAPEVRDPATALSSHVSGIRAEIPSYQVEEVTEYGPGAAWNEELVTLSVFRPGWAIDVVMDQNAAMPPREAAKALMTKVLDRLP